MDGGCVRGVSRPVISPVVRGVIGTSVLRWSPSRLTGSYAPLQWALDGGDSYYSSTLDSYQVLRPLESYGTFRKPRSGRCYLFDGTNDYATITDASLALTGEMTVTAWIKSTSDTLNQTIAGYAMGGDTHWALSYGYSDSKLSWWHNGAAEAGASNAGLALAGAWHHVAAVRSGSAGNWTITFYVDGVAAGSFTTATNPTTGGAQAFAIGRHGAYATALYFSGSIRDVRVYGVTKTAAQIAAITNQADTPTTFDTTGLLAWYKCNEEAGTVSYDSSGNGKHLTITNATLSTFHASDTGVVYNAANFVGFTLSGSTVIPRNEASTSLDAAGNALGNTGKCPHPVVVETPCITGDGTAVYADLGQQLIPSSADFSLSLWCYLPATAATESVICQSAVANGIVVYNLHTDNAMRLFASDGSGNFLTSTATFTRSTWFKLTVSRTGNVWTIGIDGVTNSATLALTVEATNTKLLSNVSSQYWSGRAADLQVTTGGVTTYFPLQEGPGSDNTNRALCYARSDGTYGVVEGAIVNGTVSTIWANRCPGYAKDWCVNYGGRLTTENLATYSDQFSNAAWTKNATSVSADSIAAPDGSLSADLITASGGGTSNYVGQAYVPSATYTVSFYVKAGTHSYFQILNNGDLEYFANFNLVTGVVGTKGTRTTSSIVALADGWYRCTATFASGGTFASSTRIYAVPSASTAYSGSLSTGGTFYLWRARIKLGSDDYAGSYAIDQVTTGSTVDANRFIPGQISGSTAADGMAKTLTAGKHGNPYSRWSPNPWAAPEMRAIGHTTTTLYAPAAAQQTVAPVDTKFRRTASAGDDRFVSTPAALTGSNKTNMEAYVA